MRFSGLVAAVLAISVGFLTPLNASETSSDEILRADNPAAVAVTLRNDGFRAKLTKTDSGRPKIETGSGGIIYDIVFYGCSNDVDCTGLLFTAGFETDNGVTLKLVNDWNLDRLVGRAFRDNQCDPVIDIYLTVNDQMPRRLWDNVLSEWDDAIAEFRDLVWSDDQADHVRATLDCGDSKET